MPDINRTFAKLVALKDVCTKTVANEGLSPEVAEALNNIGSIAQEACEVMAFYVPMVIDPTDIRKRGMVWLEFRDGPVTPCGVGWTAGGGSDSYMFTAYGRTMRGETCIVHRGQYGKTWRCWSGMPTDEQRDRKAWLG